MKRIPNVVHRPGIDAILGVPFVVLGAAGVGILVLAGVHNFLLERPPGTGTLRSILCGPQLCWQAPLSQRFTEIGVSLLFAAGFLALGAYFLLRRVEASCDPETGEIHLRRMPRFLGLLRVIPPEAWASFQVRPGFMVAGRAVRPIGWRIEGILRQGPQVWLGFVDEKKDAEVWVSWLSERTRRQARTTV